MSETPQQPQDPYSAAPPLGGSTAAPQGMPPAPQWPQQPSPGRPYDAPPTAPSNGLGVAALIFGILALVTCWTIVGGIVLGLVAIVLGLIARGRAKSGQATNGGMALTGALLGVVGLVLSILGIVGLFLLWNKSGASNYVDCIDKAHNDQAKVTQCQNDFQDRLEN